MKPEDWAKCRLKYYKYHVKKCESKNLQPMDWPAYKNCFNSRDTAEENHQRAEELLFKNNLLNMH